MIENLRLDELLGRGLGWKMAALEVCTVLENPVTALEAVKMWRKRHLGRLLRGGVLRTPKERHPIQRTACKSLLARCV